MLCMTKRHVKVLSLVSFFTEQFYSIVLSEQKCDTTLRSTCLFNSFGIVTILQQEILGAYKNINNEKLTEQAEKRLCNTLTIVRSLVTNPDIAYHFLNCTYWKCFVMCVAYILYYIGPLIEASNPRFVNIRKVSLAVLLEVSMHNDRNGEVSSLFSLYPSWKWCLLTRILFLYV